MCTCSLRTRVIERVRLEETWREGVLVARAGVQEWMGLRKRHMDSPPIGGGVRPEIGKREERVREIQVHQQTGMWELQEGGVYVCVFAAIPQGLELHLPLSE